MVYFILAVALFGIFMCYGVPILWGLHQTWKHSYGAFFIYAGGVTGFFLLMYLTSGVAIILIIPYLIWCHSNRGRWRR